MTPGVPLCHRCWTWSTIKNGYCSTCRSRIAMDVPDPSAEELAKLFGALLIERTAVTAIHTTLPDFGSLFVSEQGLLFLPYLVPQGQGVAALKDDEPIRGNPFVEAWRWLTGPQSVSTTGQKSSVCSNWPCDPVSTFMNSPGGWFAPYGTISRVEKNRQRWRFLFRGRDPINLSYGKNSKVTMNFEGEVTPPTPIWPAPIWRDVAPLFSERL